jgi:DNA-binding beta-propeller fold protein YncE
MFALILSLLIATAALQPLPHSSDLYVSGFFTASVQRFYGPRSAVPGPRPSYGRGGAYYALPVARRPWGLAFGPDGNLYVANFGTGSEAIVRVQGPFSATAGSVSTFVDSGAFFDIAFGPDGNLYAAGHGSVVRYDIVTGSLIGEFTHGHDLAEVHAIAFGADRKLYVANYDSCVTGPGGCTGSKSEIVRFDSLSGDFADVYATSGQAGLQMPWDLAFGPDGALFVANAPAASSGNILRFNPPGSRTRAVNNFSSTVFVAYPGLMPLAIAFGPDQNLYVSNGDNSGSGGGILRFDGRTGAFIDVFVPAVEGGPRGIAFAPGPN